MVGGRCLSLYYVGSLAGAMLAGEESSMSECHRLFGFDLSPYSLKVRSYFRYKGISPRWVRRNMSNEEEFLSHARLPLVPLVLSPAGEASQDSTPIIERFEAQQREPSIIPDDPALAFVSTAELDGRPFTQQPQKYHAKSLRALREKYAAIEDRAAQNVILAAAGCLDGLK